MSGRKLPIQRTNLREKRALAALLAGPVKRERLDKMAGVSNAPDLIMNLRRDLGLKIPCKIVRTRDRDEKQCVFGVYSLTDADRERISQVCPASDEAQAPHDGLSYMDCVGSLSSDEWASLVQQCPDILLGERATCPPLLVGNLFVDAALGQAFGGTA